MPRTRQPDHVFGRPDGAPGPYEALCNEPRMPQTERLFHVDFVILPDGDMVCKKCGEHFYERDDTPT